MKTLNEQRLLDEINGLKEQLDSMTARAESSESLARYWAACYRKAVKHDGRMIDTLRTKEASDEL